LGGVDLPQEIQEGEEAVEMAVMALEAVMEAVVEAVSAVLTLEIIVKSLKAKLRPFLCYITVLVVVQK
jgi:hypothetical protein